MDNSEPRPAVLLADDEPIIRELVEDALEEAGYAIISVASGAEALSALDENPGVVALVTDINFGALPRGWAIATLAREVSPSLAVIYMTGDSAHEWSAQGVPNSAVITKPFAPSQIVVALATQLNGTDGAS